MIIEHRMRGKHQNADSLNEKTEFYERQEQREADRPEIRDGFSFFDRETHDSLPLTRFLDKSGKPIEDHPELPTEHQEKAILKRKSGRPKKSCSKIVKDSQGDAECKRLRPGRSGNKKGDARAGFDEIA